MVLFNIATPFSVSLDASSNRMGCAQHESSRFKSPALPNLKSNLIDAKRISDVAVWR